MLCSLGIIFIGGIIGSKICEKLKLPSLVGFILMGILIGPYVANIVDESLLDVSSIIRKIALIIILLRAGLTLDISDVRTIGLPAVLMSFVPATLEILTAVVAGVLLFHRTPLEMAVVGSILGAVSPAVVVPRMINLIEEHKGDKHHVPQLILAGASADDIFVVVVFTSFLNMLNNGDSIQLMSLIEIPIVIIIGIAVGIVLGFLINYIIKNVTMIHEYRVLLVLGVCFLLVFMEDNMHFMFSSLLAVMSMGIVLRTTNKECAMQINTSCNSLWKWAEIMLFTLVGTLVDISYAFSCGLTVLLFVVICLVGRMAGVALCVSRTNFTAKEKLFAMMAYCPKATVQAAIGALPLSYGLAIGDLALTVAVVAILLTAPIGAFCIDTIGERLLEE